jgi:CubicO group peptidase (beta-lactamase class C family)
MWTVEGLHGAALVTVDGSVAVDVAGGPATSETRFPIASLGKQFAAVAALLLAERGALKLDQPVSHWLPGRPPRWREITLHHLLTHTSGMSHWQDAPGYVLADAIAIDERVPLLMGAEPHSRPGARWCYSSPGYLLAAHIIERAAGQDYASFLAEQVFAPAGLASTTTGRPDGVAYARGHRAGEALPEVVLPVLAGTSDVWSTVGDLARWSGALHTGAVLGWESLMVLTGPLAPTGEEPVAGWSYAGAHYGYGLYIGTVGGHRAYFHPGDVPGFVTFGAWLPDRRAGIVVLADDETVDVHPLIRQLLSAAGLS